MVEAKGTHADRRLVWFDPVNVSRRQVGGVG